ncbi:hypothetical protein T484DRAFT_1889017 [Baffinella frigidus]|nr:hypothetical protein T484DRAFT_1889017 [Cryptophyta sp. CCMP2293]|mmetsp:Transcript_16129/g.38902  ORF Transcript_16129/g.38902 Transcript_16129/m.38902 type:complete len:119 (-) Transcript_16129:40-396(-)
MQASSYRTLGRCCARLVEVQGGAGTRRLLATVAVKSLLPIKERLEQLQRRGRGPTPLDPEVVRRMREDSSTVELRKAAVVLGLAAGFIWIVQRGQFLSQEDASVETPGEKGSDEREEV